ncbi:MAG: DNA adenine methylase [Phycisphaerales bacterium]
MIKYIGSKRVLIPAIRDIISSLDGVETVVDFFSGTARVGHAMKSAGYRVVSNDLLTYAYTLANCYVQADREDVLDDAAKLLGEFRKIRGSPGYFTETFCEKSRFFQPHNGERIDAIREAIAKKGLDPELEAVCLVSLMEAADRVDSTTGVQMAYLKKWAARAYNNLELRMPDVRPASRYGKCEAHHLEAREAAKVLSGDVAYIDPPYNQHTYIGNYHVWESLILWDKPEVYGIACKRIDCRDRKSDFNSKRKAIDALRHFFAAVDCRYLVVSFSNEGYVSREEMETMLELHGDVYIVEKDHKRYVGAQIGIYNPSGELVGKVSHLRNKEYIYVVVPAGQPWGFAEDLQRLAEPEPTLFS